MKHEIKNNFGKTIYTTEVDGRKHKTLQAKLKQAVFMAVSDGADLTGADLRGADLEGAYLRGADLTGANLRGADLTGANLTGAYRRGADLTGANLRGADLTGANLRGADLEGAYLTGAYPRGAYLTGAYRRGADLTGANLRGADLTGAYRRGAYLEGAYLNVPVIKNIHQEIQKATKHKGALKMGDWHCGTSHCRAGWAVHLAGDAGYELEKKTSTATAAYLIYRKSSDLPFALNFYASNEDALAEINRMAEIEASA